VSGEDPGQLPATSHLPPTMTNEQWTMNIEQLLAEMFIVHCSLLKKTWAKNRSDANTESEKQPDEERRRSPRVP
jgi:hypothetical protein